MIEVLKTIHEIVKELPKLRDKPFERKTHDSDVDYDYLSTGHEVQYSFSVRESDNPAHHQKQINFVLSKSTITHLAASVQTVCSFNVVFDVAWYFNAIAKCYQQFSLNNIPESSAYFMNTGSIMVAILPEQITEEWLFQLLTLHDVPYYEEMVEYNNIRNTIMELPFKMSFNIAYQEQYCSTFLEQIKRYLDEA